MITKQRKHRKVIFQCATQEVKVRYWMHEIYDEQYGEKVAKYREILQANCHQDKTSSGKAIAILTIAYQNQRLPDYCQGDSFCAP